MVYLLYHLFFLLLGGNAVLAQAPQEYNVIWTTQSKNTSESMPCGGGDIGLNVWVENGEVMVYGARSGSFNEDNALMKAGRIRIKLLPNPFEGTAIKQELHLQQGFVTIDGEHNGVKATLRIWVDVFEPVVHFEVTSSRKITVEATYESWRYQDRLIKARENFANSWKWAPPKNKIYPKDQISFNSGGVLFYHNNGERTIFDTTVSQQGLDGVKDQLYNPLKNLAFGGLLSGDKFIAAGENEGKYVNTDFKGWKLKSASPGRRHELIWVLHTIQANYFGEWHQSLKTILLKAKAKNAFANTQKWWKEFWGRSFIHLPSPDTASTSWKMGRNFQLFRYMLACNAHGVWPTKFNGGLLTVDPVFTDRSNELTPDYRNWGGGLHTAQNQRLVYFPMIKNGDWDLLKPQLDFYLRILKNAELRSKVYWDHGGASFTEQMENYGIPNYAEYGTRRPDNFDKGVEYNAWLEYEWDTVLEFCLMMLDEELYTGNDISSRLPFIESCIQFFYEHYAYEGRKRTARLFDDDGKLTFYPGSGAETFKMATNSTATLAALRVIINRMLALPAKYINTGKRNHYDSLLKRTPDISYATFNGHTTIAPAKSWERVNNTESPQLYPVFPWGIFGVGKPGLDTAINTWNHDTNVVKFRSHLGWKQDNIWAARLGLTNEAWRLTSLKLKDAERRFPAFWGPGFDWVPDHNWGGSGMIGLQEMLMQVDDERILLFPAWPKDKDVHFKLHAPYNTTVEAEYKNGKLESLKVFPEERRKDVEILLK
ncbi:MAG: hypothetical protein H7Y42_05995 [Chitinophagaceae bacterium]|nr:hypothetical protein [Chitinophagaceae bacterium]